MVEAEIFEFFKEFDPTSAYLNGLKEYAGKLFIPSRRNLERFSGRVEELRLKAENKSQEKALDSVSASYTLGEPHGVSEMIKEGIVPSHLRPLTKNGIRAIETGIIEKSGKDWPTGLRILALVRCDGL